MASGLTGCVVQVGSTGHTLADQLTLCKCLAHAGAQDHCLDR